MVELHALQSRSNGGRGIRIYLTMPWLQTTMMITPMPIIIMKSLAIIGEIKSRWTARLDF